MALGRQRVRKEGLFMRRPFCLRVAIRALSIGGNISMGFALRALPLTFHVSPLSLSQREAALWRGRLLLVLALHSNCDEVTDEYKLCYIFIYPRFAE